MTAMLVPVGIAYAQASALPGITGLYATIAPLLAYAVFGPSPILILGPDFSDSSDGRRDVSLERTLRGVDCWAVRNQLQETGHGIHYVDRGWANRGLACWASDERWWLRGASLTPTSQKRFTWTYGRRSVLVA